MFIKTRHSGFSLVELVMFIVIVSIAVAGVLMVLRITSAHSADPQLRKQALAIAEALLEEVELARFTYCYPEDPNATIAVIVAGSLGPPGGCSTSAAIQVVGLGQTAPHHDTRPYYNVNDYVTAYSTPQAAFTNAGALVDAAGLPISVTGSGNYTASLTITPTPLGPPGSIISSDGTPVGTNVLRITVIVSYGSNSVTLEGYRTRYAPTYVP